MTNGPWINSTDQNINQDEVIEVIPRLESEVKVEVTGVITIGFCGFLFFVLLIIVIKSRTAFNEIDEKYGKPYEAKLVKMIGGHPDLKPGSMAVTFHPKDAIAFNRKVFLFSQINSIKIINKLPEKLSNGKTMAIDSGVDKQYLCLAVTDESGEHEVVFTTESDFEKLANKLVRQWNKYNLF